MSIMSSVKDLLSVFSLLEYVSNAREKGESGKAMFHQFMTMFDFCGLPVFVENKSHLKSVQQGKIFLHAQIVIDDVTHAFVGNLQTSKYTF